MTATPRYFTGRVKTEAKEADWEVASMDDEETVSARCCIDSRSPQAIERDLLSDYHVVVVGVSDETYRECAERGASSPVTARRSPMRGRSAARSDSSAPWRSYDLRRLVTFHSRIRASASFARSVLDVVDWMPARRTALRGALGGACLRRNDHRRA